MAIVQLLGSLFQKMSSPGADYSSLQKGQVAWVPCPYIDSVTRILDVERATARGHNDAKYELRRLIPMTFKKIGRLPITELIYGIVKNC